jgi:hypothetical protein
MGMFGEFLLPLGSCWGGNGNSHDRKKKTLLSLSKSCQCPRFLVLPSDGSFDSEVCLCIQCDTHLHDQIRRDKLLIAAVSSTKKKTGSLFCSLLSYNARLLSASASASPVASNERLLLQLL